MRNKMMAVYCVMVCALAFVFVFSPAVVFGSPASENEEDVWNLEHSYWHYVQDNNLSAYLPRPGSKPTPADAFPWTRATAPRWSTYTRSATW